MSENEHIELVENVKQIRRALVGDKALGHRGLVDEVYSHSQRIGRLERGALWLMGGAGALSVAYRLFLEWVHLTGGRPG